LEKKKSHEESIKIEKDTKYETEKKPFWGRGGQPAASDKAQKGKKKRANGAKKGGRTFQKGRRRPEGKSRNHDQTLSDNYKRRKTPKTKAHQRNLPGVIATERSPWTNWCRVEHRARESRNHHNYTRRPQNSQSKSLTRGTCLITTPGRRKITATKITTEEQRDHAKLGEEEPSS